VTDIKHVFAQNPLHPVFRKRTEKKRQAPPQTGFIVFDEAVACVGYRGNGFSYDNEGPQHRALVPKFSLGSRLITCGEYQRFIEAGGYQRSEFWLSLGWMTVNEQRWEAPLYWEDRSKWKEQVVFGVFVIFPCFRPFEEHNPLTQLIFFEPAAFAIFSGARL